MKRTMTLKPELLPIVQDTHDGLNVLLSFNNSMPESELDLLQDFIDSCREVNSDTQLQIVFPLHRLLDGTVTYLRSPVHHDKVVMLEEHKPFMQKIQDELKVHVIKLGRVDYSNETVTFAIFSGSAAGMKPDAGFWCEKTKTWGSFNDATEYSWTNMRILPLPESPQSDATWVRRQDIQSSGSHYSSYARRDIALTASVINGTTFAKAGAEHGITVERARQIFCRMLRVLRGQLMRKDAYETIQGYKGERNYDYMELSAIRQHKDFWLKELDDLKVVWAAKLALPPKTAETTKVDRNAIKRRRIQIFEQLLIGRSVQEVAKDFSLDQPTIKRQFKQHADACGERRRNEKIEFPNPRGYAYTYLDEMVKYPNFWLSISDLIKKETPDATWPTPQVPESMWEREAREMKEQHEREAVKNREEYIRSIRCFELMVDGKGPDEAFNEFQVPLNEFIPRCVAVTRMLVVNLRRPVPHQGSITIFKVREHKDFWLEELARKKKEDNIE